MLKLENFLKGPLTTLFGFVLMCAVSYGWWIDSVTDTQAIIGVIAGFAIMFMRVKLEESIGTLFNAAIEKFFGKKQ